jgi:hypothetical protein
MTIEAICQHCSKPLYRSAAAGTKVRKDAPRVVCRNADCPGKKPKVQPTPIQRRRKVSQLVAPKKPPPAPPVEPLEPEDLVAATRQWVRAQLNLLAKGEDENAIALTLALACEETGNPEAAAVLAVKHGLKRMGYVPSGS